LCPPDAAGRGVRLSLSLLRKRVRHFGLRRYCPACGSHTRRFQEYGAISRPDAKCPVCDSTERERAQVLLLRTKVLPRLAGRADPIRILHVAPEPGVERVLRALPRSRYLSGDFEPGRAMAALDLTNLKFPDAAFDFVFVSHVLEHIPDDRRAMAELLRVLSPGGVAFIEVPVLASCTYEDAAITRPAERLAAFGQSDHVRICGIDYEDRLREAGFEVIPLWIKKEFSADELSKMRLVAEITAEVRAQMPPRYEQQHDVAWLCAKPGAA
jgi:SAM-dependent methyltransferase